MKFSNRLKVMLTRVSLSKFAFNCLLFSVLIVGHLVDDGADSFDSPVIIHLKLILNDLMTLVDF